MWNKATSGPDLMLGRDRQPRPASSILQRSTAMMNEREKSDEAIVPMKPVNNAKDFWSFVAELAEGRAPAKENEREQAEDREEHGAAPAQADQASQPQETQRSCKKLPPCAPMGGKATPKAGCPAALHRIRQAALVDKKLRFTNLFHHVYAVGHLRRAYFELSKRAAPGIDGQTWSDYGQELEGNLQNLSHRLARGKYHAPPVKRVYNRGKDADSSTVNPITTRNDSVFDAIDALHKNYPRAAEVMSLHVFAKNSLPSIAKLIDVSLSTLEKDWRFAKVWMKDYYRSNGEIGNDS
jgi:hypothetical protein